MSKAFDKVDYGKLFKLLIYRRMPSLTVKLLLDSYTRQQLCVSQDLSISWYFNVSNCIKQDGVLPAILYMVYLDELIILLKNSDVGYHVGTELGNLDMQKSLLLLTN